jgi:hypothetical protein
MRYWCQDESRFGLKTILGRLITLCGVKPQANVSWQRDNFYVYGLVEPLTGERFFWEFSHLDTACFQRVYRFICSTVSRRSQHHPA